MKKTCVSLRLMSDQMSPEQIGEELGAPADNSWHKGARRKETGLIEKENGYEFQALLDTDAPLEEQIDILLRRLDPIIEKIRALRCDHVQLTCAVYASEVPSIWFPPSVIERLGRMGASIDVDLYIAEGNWAE
ncbi:DUF4279 domain-containing protein [Sorangium sp. So ce887]|uniref:DUF4279 domain-containing protein n=1 Tax=Sorangium sp. So ce887 TaxID=3133324 RepID=UPI003F606008